MGETGRAFRERDGFLERVREGGFLERERVFRE